MNCKEKTKKPPKKVKEDIPKRSKFLNGKVCVVSKDNKPLMPTTIYRATKWIKSRRATGFYKKGIFCIRMNEEVGEITQPIVVGVDSGSKREGVTVKSEKITYLNLQLEAVDWVKDHMEARKNARRTRRYRKTPCRKPRFNRSRKIGWMPPSTKARWQWKLRVLNFLRKIFPVTDVSVEDIKAETKESQRKWNASFSPLQTGKNWFYEQIRETGVRLHLFTGFQTSDERKRLGLKKNSDKLKECFYSHCVDSWTLANFVVGGHVKPDCVEVAYWKPLKFHRRQLNVFCPVRDGIRKTYGSTKSMGLRRGSLVRHDRWGLAYVGGTSNNRISLHDISSNKRLSQNVNVVDCKFLCYNSWSWR
jgi:hypothetical protein